MLQVKMRRYKSGCVFLTLRGILPSINFTAPQRSLPSYRDSFKDRRRSGQPRITTRRQDGKYRRLHRRYSLRPATVSFMENRAPRVICFRFLMKIFYYN